MKFFFSILCCFLLIFIFTHKYTSSSDYHEAAIHNIVKIHCENELSYLLFIDFGTHIESKRKEFNSNGLRREQVPKIICDVPLGTPMYIEYLRLDSFWLGECDRDIEIHVHSIEDLEGN